MQQTFNADNFYQICDTLYRKDKDLKKIVDEHGYPPIWMRPPSFQTLILTILEQQVSLASAYAAFKKLRKKTGNITPAKIMDLTDDELRKCYFSRQKIVYARELAKAILLKKLHLKKLESLDNDNVRTTLKKIKGIGDWTVDIYLIHALRRLDIFPIGDLALVNSLKEIKNLSGYCTKEEMLAVSIPWRPFRTIASMILWHSYIQKRGIKLLS